MEDDSVTTKEWIELVKAYVRCLAKLCEALDAAEDSPDEVPADLP